MDVSWTVKKAEHRGIDAFELWCWKRLLRVPWTARRSNQSILKISPGCSLVGLILKLKLPILWPPDAKNWLLKRPWCWERLRAGEGDDRGWDGWMASPTQWTRFWIDSRSWWWTGRPGVLQFMGLQRVGHDWVTELNWTEHTHKPSNTDEHLSTPWRVCLRMKPTLRTNEQRHREKYAGSWWGYLNFWIQAT